MLQEIIGSSTSGEVGDNERKSTLVPYDRPAIVGNGVKGFTWVGVNLRCNHKPAPTQFGMQRSHTLGRDVEDIGPGAMQWAVSVLDNDVAIIGSAAEPKDYTLAFARA